MLVNAQLYPPYPHVLYIGACVLDVDDQKTSFSTPEPMILMARGRDRELWPGPTPEVHDSWTSPQIWQI